MVRRLVELAAGKYQGFNLTRYIGKNRGFCKID